MRSISYFSFDRALRPALIISISLTATLSDNQQNAYSDHRTIELINQQDGIRLTMHRDME
jgi:hypothetical protein